MKQYLLFLLFLSCFALLICGQRTAGQSPQPTSQPQQTEEDLIHFGDVIDVDVVGGFEFDWRGTLTPEGFLDGLDGFSDPVFGLCRSEANIAADVAKVYGKILREPKIIVKIIDRSNRAVVRLDGAVKTPARFRLKRNVYLKELLVLAGGLTDGASGDVTIYRPKNLSCRTTSDDKAPQDNGSQTINIKISELLSGIAAADPQILSGDMIMVEQAMPVYVIGAVNNPRPIYSRDKITVSRAIASAGGLAKEAEGNKVSIFRRDGSGSQVIEADLGKIKRGEIVDEVLKPFDIIDVASKGGGKRKYTPLVANSENRDHSKPDLPLRVVD